MVLICVVYFIASDWAMHGENLEGHILTTESMETQNQRRSRNRQKRQPIDTALAVYVDIYNASVVLFADLRRGVDVPGIE